MHVSDPAVKHCITTLTFAGFYTHYPICQPLFYSNTGATGWEYMTAIVVFNFFAFLYIAIAYLVIYKASSRPCVRKSVRKRTKQWRNDNRKMQRKIFFLSMTNKINLSLLNDTNTKMCTSICSFLSNLERVTLC